MMDYFKDIALEESDYSYIQYFIIFLKEIIDIIKDLFSGLNLGGSSTPAEE